MDGLGRFMTPRTLLCARIPRNGRRIGRGRSHKRPHSRSYLRGPSIGSRQDQYVYAPCNMAAEKSDTMCVATLVSANPWGLNPIRHWPPDPSSKRRCIRRMESIRRSPQMMRTASFSIERRRRPHRQVMPLAPHEETSSPFVLEGSRGRGAFVS